MCKLRWWRRFVGLSGSSGIGLVLKKKKLINSHVDLVIYACVFIRYWAGLHGEDDRAVLQAGADTLQQNALADAAAMDVAPVPFLGLPAIPGGHAHEAPELERGREKRRRT